MILFKYIIFGLIQGLTEPLPISSSGHLFLFKYLFNTNTFNDLNFEIILNFASFIAIFFIFREDIIRLIKSFLTYIFDSKKRKKKEIKEDFKYCWLIVLGCVPAGLVGALFKDQIESLISIKLLGISFIVTALALLFVKNKDGKRLGKDLTVKDAIIIGLFQMIALMPGISRSGSVLVGCFLMGLKREDALKYAFMLYLPVSIGSFVLGITDLNIGPHLIGPYIYGFLASMVMTYFASLWFFDVVKKGKLYKFSIYLVIVGLLCLLVL